MNAAHIKPICNFEEFIDEHKFQDFLTSPLIKEAYTLEGDEGMMYIRRVLIAHIDKAIELELSGDLRLKEILINFIQEDMSFNYYDYNSVYARLYFNRTGSLPVGFDVSDRKLMEQASFIRAPFFDIKGDHNYSNFIYADKLEDIYGLYQKEYMISYLLTQYDLYKLHIKHYSKFPYSNVFELMNVEINNQNIYRDICLEIADRIDSDMLLTLSSVIESYHHVFKDIENNEKTAIFISFLKHSYQLLIDEWPDTLKNHYAIDCLKEQYGKSTDKYPELHHRIDTIFELYGEIDLAMYDVLTGMISKDPEIIPVNLDF